jgi:hypothetical protein
MTVSLTPRPSPACGRGARRESAAPTFTERAVSREAAKNKKENQELEGIYRSPDGGATVARFCLNFFA